MSARRNVEPLVLIFLLVFVVVCFALAAFAFNDRVERLEQQITCGQAATAGCQP